MELLLTVAGLLLVWVLLDIVMKDVAKVIHILDKAGKR